jgi:hypothetical protein
MSIIGYTLLVLGCIVWIVGEVMFLARAYRQSLGWFLGCLFIPLVPFVFLFMHFRLTIRPFALAICGFLVAAIGGWMAGVQL